MYGSGRKKYLDINSSTRDRVRYPLASSFSIQVSSSGDRTIVDAIDPVATSTPELVFNFAFNKITQATTLSGTVEQVVGVGAGTSNLRLIVQVAANALFRATDYYTGSVLRKGGDGRRITSFRYLNTSTNYALPGSSSDRAAVTIAGAFPGTLAAGDAVSFVNTSDLSDGLFPLVFVPTGSDRNNFYKNHIVFNQTTQEYRPVLYYDGSSRLLQLDTATLGGVGWTTAHTLTVRQTLPLQAGTIASLGTTSTVVLPGMLDVVYTGSFVRISASPTDLAGETRRIIAENRGTNTLTVSRSFSTVPGSAVANGVFRDSAFTVVNGTKEAVATLSGNYSWLFIGTAFKIGNASGILSPTTFAVTAIIPPTIYESGNRTALISATQSGAFCTPFSGAALVNGNLVDGLNDLNPARPVGSYLSFTFAEIIVITGLTLVMGSGLPGAEQFTVQGISGATTTTLATFSNATTATFSVNFPNTQAFGEYRLVANTAGAVIVSIHEVQFTVSTTFVRYVFDTVPPSVTTYLGGTTSPGDARFYEIVYVPTYFEVLPFTSDNAVSIDFPNSLAKKTEYEVQLLSITLPNLLLQSSIGGKLVDYPYVYIEISNSSSPTTNLIYSNNRNASKALFKVPIVDISEDWRSSFLKLSNPGMPQKITINLLDGIDFAVKTPDGKLLQFIAAETYSPSPPNVNAQIAATFCFDAIEEKKRMNDPAERADTQRPDIQYF